MITRILAILVFALAVTAFQCPPPFQPPASPFDFDHDDKADISVYRPSTGDWWILNSSNGSLNGARFGLPTDKIVPADYTGDHMTDLAVFRDGTWFILRSDNFTNYQVPFGLPGDIPAPGDFDNWFIPYKVDLAVYRPSEGMWYINSENAGVRFVRFGLPDDKPVVADYDGDGRQNIGLFRPGTGEWYILDVTMTNVTVKHWGLSTDKLVPADYTGDKKADIAIFRPPTGEWWILKSDDSYSSSYGFKFGMDGDMAIPADYDGDGRTDPAVFRPDEAMWYLYCTKAGVMMEKWGVAGDMPAPNAYIK